MKILKHKKNIILSLVLSFALFLSVAVTIPQKTAKAEIPGTIYDYDWANYFNFANVNILSLSDEVGYSTSANSASQSIICTVTNADLFTTYSYLTIDVIGNFSMLSNSVVPDIVEDEIYSFSCSVRSNRDLDFEFNYCVFQIGFFRNNVFFSSTIYDSDRNGYYDYFSPSNYESGNIYFRLMMYLDPGDSSFENGDTIIFENIALYHGTDIYTYTPYFYSLNNLPNPLPGINGGDSSSDSSSSVSSSSDSSSSDSSPSDSSSSDSSFSDSSYYDSGYSDGYSDGFLEGESVGYDSGYSDGYSDGESVGYDNGYADGVKYAQYGIFWNCQCYIQLNYQYDYERISITDDFFIYGGLDLSKFLPLVENKTDVLSSFIFFNFGDSTSIRPTVSQFRFHGTGSEDSFIENPWFVTLENTPNSRNLHWEGIVTSSGNISYYLSEFLEVGIAGSTVVLSFKTPTFSTFDYLDDFTIVMRENQYYAGYTKGESDGYANGLQAGLDDNQEEIYNEGHRVGFDDGFAKGYSENNSFLGLFTAAIDAPVLTFTSMLDFDILGYNMKAVVLSLLSAALVVCIIRLFAKGGAT